MTVLNPEHLLAQARVLTAAPSAGPPRQVDVRRAISAAYYAVFHAILTAAADEFVGVGQRVKPNYALVYRSIDHRHLSAVCSIARAKVPPAAVPGVRGRCRIRRRYAYFCEGCDRPSSTAQHGRLRPDRSIPDGACKSGDRTRPYCSASLASSTGRPASFAADATAVPAAIAGFPRA